MNFEAVVCEVNIRRKQLRGFGCGRHIMAYMGEICPARIDATDDFERLGK